MRFALAGLFAVILSLNSVATVSSQGKTWVGSIECPGGAIEFLIQRQHPSNSKETLTIKTGGESIKIDQWKIDEGKMIIGFPHYDSKIEAKFDRQKKAFIGVWRKRQSPSKVSELAFSARTIGTPHSVSNANTSFSGRWKVKFEKSSDPAVGVFKVRKDGDATGTFLTTTGDYRFLDGHVVNNKMTLSTFDGAHAFLFRATLDKDNRIAGQFWSRDSWNEKWTAVKDDNAKLPDAFKLTTWNSNVPLSKTKVTSLGGKEMTLADQQLLGEKGTLIYLFGSWCPNCHDAGKYLTELQKKYGSQGINIVGVAFELGDDQQRNAAQVKKYLARHGASFTVVLGGRADLGKKAATQQLNLVDKIRSYPTTIFVNPDQSIRAIHTGFSGPATGKAYDQLKADFVKLIEQWLK